MPIFEIKAKHRMLKVNSQLIIYKAENQIIKIDRILHERMDINEKM